MRISQTFIIMSLVGLLMTGCQSDDEQSVISSSGEQTSVKFELDASAITYDFVNNSGLKYTPTYAKEGFKIYAFRRPLGGSDYVYEKAINVAGMTYSPGDKKLVGSDLLNIGTYKFVCAYGVEQPGVVNLPILAGQTLTDNLLMAYNGTSLLGEIFLEDGGVAGLTSYDLGLTNAANPTVSATLKRAVSRVDVMIFKGKKENGVYIELPYTNSNVFGQKTLETFQLRYKGLNSTMDFWGNLSSAPTFDANFNLSNFSEIITIGTAGSTIVGNDTYTRYDNVQEADIIKGGAHVFGNYQIPNPDDAKTTDIEIYIKPVNEEGRTITLTEKIPTEINKVTLIKIYILDNGGPEEPNVFTTNVKFEVVVETVWNGSHEVSGEIS